MKTQLSVRQTLTLTELGIDESNATGVTYYDPYDLDDAIEEVLKILTETNDK